MTSKQTTGFMWFMLESIFKLSCDVKLCWIIKLSHRGCCDLGNFENSIPSSPLFFVAEHQSSASCWEFSICHVFPAWASKQWASLFIEGWFIGFQTARSAKWVNLATHQFQTHSEQLRKFLRGSTHKTLPARWREFGEGVPESLSRQMPPKRRHSIFIAWENTFRERKVSSRGAGSNHPIYFDFDLITHIRSSHRVAKKKFISVDRRSALRRIEMSLFCVYFRFGWGGAVVGDVAVKKICFVMRLQMSKHRRHWQLHENCDSTLTSLRERSPQRGKSNRSSRKIPFRQWNPANREFPRSICASISFVIENSFERAF